MLCSLSTVKARVALDPLDTTNDALLLRAISAISARFDQETNRTLARTENAMFEFPADAAEILVPCFPIETITRFELKISESLGWIEQLGVEHLIRRGCIISLLTPLADLQPQTSDSRQALARVTYTGGYLLPDSAAVPGATPLPADLEQAAVEQTAYWFQTRNQLGVIRQWPRSGDYLQFADPDLLPSVRETLQRHTRFAG